MYTIEDARPRESRMFELCHSCTSKNAVLRYILEIISQKYIQIISLTLFDRMLYSPSHENMSKFS